MKTANTSGKQRKLNNKLLQIIRVMSTLRLSKTIIKRGNPISRSARLMKRVRNLQKTKRGKFRTVILVYCIKNDYLFFEAIAYSMTKMRGSAILEKLSTIWKVKRVSKSRGLACSIMKQKSDRRSSKLQKPNTKKRRGGTITLKARAPTLKGINAGQNCKQLYILHFRITICSTDN